MLDLFMLAQDSTVGGTGIGIVVGSGIGASVVGYIVQRSLRRTLDHVDNPKIHVSPDNGYVRESMCKERHLNLEEKMDALKQDMKDGFREVKDLINKDQ